MMARDTDAGGIQRRRVAVIDIGSNSIRLVVFDRLGRAPVPIFNEKVLCGLGRSLHATGRLDPEGWALAVENLRRFRRLCDGMNAVSVSVVATAAVRDAEDGPDFVIAVRDQCGLAMRVISGEEEARLAALGLMSGLPAASGVVGDLGGGSLELVDVEAGAIRNQVTLPLGPLRLMAAGGSKGAARSAVRAALDAVPWLETAGARPFFPIGGAWRSIAKVYMGKVKHPLRVIHGLEVQGDRLRDMAGLISRQGKTSLDRLTGVSRRRLETLPHAAMVLDEVLARLTPETVTFSAFGLREGLLFDQLSAEEQASDPLIAGCRDLAHRNDRFGPEGAIERWTRGVTPMLAADQERLRIATCLLSDIGWSEHPDYRSEHAAMRVLRLPIGGLTHQDRAFLALAIAARYGGEPARGAMPTLDLLDDDAIRAATLVGLVLRLAHTVSGGAPIPLDGTHLDLSGDPIALTVAPDQAALIGDVVRRRLDAVAKALGRGAEVLVSPPHWERQAGE